MKVLLAIAIMLSPGVAWAGSSGLFDGVGNQYSGSQGWNSRTGSTWQNYGYKGGVTSGVDKAGGEWHYDPNSGYYSNHLTGRICTGKGTNRVCGE
jgi:hypothetical protein